MDTPESGSLQFARMSEPVVSRYVWVDTDQKVAWLQSLNAIPSITASPADVMRVGRGEEVLVDKTLIQVSILPERASTIVATNGYLIEHAIESVGTEVPLV